VTVCLACDNQANDMLETMRATWLIHGTMWGIPRYDPEYLMPETILAMATIDAAKVLQMDDLVGSLEADKAADLVVLDGRRPHLFPVQDLLTEVIRFATRAEVQHVMVDGKLLVEDGRNTSIDMDALFRDAMPAAARERETISHRRYKPLPSA
jgi:cytosine/adenosine deaminase-related metal-dependent hydrolase